MFVFAQEHGIVVGADAGLALPALCLVQPPADDQRPRPHGGDRPDIGEEIADIDAPGFVEQGRGLVRLSLVLQQPGGGDAASDRDAAAARQGRRDPRRAGDDGAPPRGRCARDRVRRARHACRRCRAGPVRFAAPERSRASSRTLVASPSRPCVTLMSARAMRDAEHVGDVADCAQAVAALAPVPARRIEIALATSGRCREAMSRRRGRDGRRAARCRARARRGRSCREYRPGSGQGRRGRVRRRRQRGATEPRRTTT